MKDIMLRKYHRDFTLECYSGTEDTTKFTSLKEVQEAFKVEEVIKTKDKVIVITKNAILIYRRDD